MRPNITLTLTNGTVVGRHSPRPEHPCATAFLTKDGLTMGFPDFFGPPALDAETRATFTNEAIKWARDELKLLYLQVDVVTGDAADRSVVEKLGLKYES